jgi:hypothetical protein
LEPHRLSELLQPYLLHLPHRLSELLQPYLLHRSPELKLRPLLWLPLLLHLRVSQPFP